VVSSIIGGVLGPLVFGHEIDLISIRACFCRFVVVYSRSEAGRVQSPIRLTTVSNIISDEDIQYSLC